MARLTRIDLPGIPQHIVQRGNNRLPCFLDDGDRLRYLHLIHEALHATGRQLHAFVLMDNHVHLLVAPPDAGRIGQLMQRLGETTSHCSMAATGALVRYGKGGTKRVCGQCRLRPSLLSLH
ncbi:transposase [Xanthomonas arboricola]|uniref:transposase n=1 Tax=Xanthomonas arboricola TaxID=56448 RepID=UPI00215785BB|nr:transposase [Xanthomonas arboricola]